MRFFLILFTLALIIASCAEDAPYEPDPQPEITINISPSRMDVNLGDTLRFTASDSHQSRLTAIWKVENIQGGDQTFGTIDSSGSSGLYTAPSAVPYQDSVSFDSVSVTATLSDDVSIIDTAWVILVDPDRIYVDTTGSDSTGAGSKYSPYRTITYAVNVAESGQIIQVGPGIYDVAGGEIFPIVIGLGVTLIGAGIDSSIVVGSGGSHDRPGAVFAIEQPAINLKDFEIRTNDSNGIGVWVQGFMSATNIIGNRITSNYCGINVSGPGNTIPTIDDNIIKLDSIGVLTKDACRPTNNSKYYRQLLDLRRPDRRFKRA